MNGLQGLFPGFLDPQTQGLLSAGAGLLQAGGPSRMPISTGQALGQGLQGGMQGYRVATEANMQEQQRAIALQEAMQRLRINEMLRSIAAGGLAGGQQMPQQASQQGQQSPQPQALYNQQGGFSSAPSPMPTPQAAPQQQQPGAAQSQLPFSVPQIAAMKMLPGGPDLTGLYSATQPDVHIDNGVMLNRKGGNILGTVPTINQQGFGTQLMPDGKGGWQISVVPGAANAYGLQQGIGAAAQADQDVLTIPSTGPDQPPRQMTRAQRVQQLGGGGVPGLQGGAGAGMAAGMSPQQETEQAARRSAATSGTEGQLKIFNENYEQGLKGAQSLPVMIHARAALDKGAITGFGADFRLNYGRALSLAGFKGSQNDVENTQVFASTMSRQVLNIIKNLGSGSGISDADREYAAKIVGGDIKLDEKSMRKLLDISELAVNNQIKWVNGQVPYWSGAGAMVRPIDTNQFTGITGPIPKDAAGPDALVRKWLR